MTEPNKRVVQRRSDGDWEVRKPGADRASAITPTQAEAFSGPARSSATTVVAKCRSARSKGRSARKTRSYPGTIRVRPRGDLGRLVDGGNPCLSEDERDSTWGTGPRTYGQRRMSRART
ncbi:DUF2188 domain-containing protein [Microlunatus panaciterrae]|uniref:DUF2188 domain-containing protein n=1 Tax=Microlunatus panaciterrae TaxID=400768 RepID=UPI001EF90990